MGDLSYIVVDEMVVKAYIIKANESCKHMGICHCRQTPWIRE